MSSLQGMLNLNGSSCVLITTLKALKRLQYSRLGY